jgi:DNA helicase-2/ATP-dependent DNA helicase PcrA
VSGVLPALGVNGVPVTTVRAWASTLRKRLVPTAPDRYADETPAAVSRLKKHPGMMLLLEAAVDAETDAVRAHLAARLGEAAAPVLASWDARASKPPLARLRAVKKRLGELGLSEATLQTVELAIKQARGRLTDVSRIVWEALTDRGRLEAALRAPGTHEPATTQELDELVRWSAAQLEEEEPAEYEGVDPERREAVDGKPLVDGSDRAEEVAAGRLDREDDALLLYAYQLLHGDLERVDGQPLVYDHIAIDEAQDLAAIEVRVLYNALDETKSLTIAGDVAQRVIFDNGFRGWEGLVADLRLPGGTASVETLIRPLKLAYRSTAPVMRFARAVLGPLAATEDADADVVARDGAPVELHELGGMGEAVAFVADALRSLLAREPTASVALLTRHAGQADAWAAALKRAEVPSLRRVRRQDFTFTPGVDVTDVGQVKGLEFDYVILLDVNDTSYPPTIESRHLLHIGATRATHQLWVVSTGKTSELVEELVRAEEGEGGNSV